MIPDAEESDFTVAEDVHHPTHQLAPDIMNEASVDYALADIVTKLWHLHPQLKRTGERHRYYVKGVANSLGTFMLYSQNQTYKNKAAQDYDHKFWGKCTGKLLKILWPIHVLLYIFKNCRNKAQLDSLSCIPCNIDDELVIRVTAVIYQNSSVNYRTPLEAGSVKKPLGNTVDDRPDLSVFVMNKILTNCKTTFVARDCSTAWSLSGSRAKTKEVLEAFTALVKSGFGTMKAGKTGTMTVFTKGCIPSCETTTVAKTLKLVELTKEQLVGFPSAELSDVEEEEDKGSIIRSLDESKVCSSIDNLTPLLTPLRAVHTGPRFLVERLGVDSVGSLVILIFFVAGPSGLILTS